MRLTLLNICCLFIAILGLWTSAAAQVTFERHDYVTGVSTSAIAVGDFNGDRIPDLAVANFTDRTVSILLGNGDGSFTPRGTFPTTSGPIRIVTADFNGDGRADLAIINTDDTVRLFLGKGDGTFSPGRSWAMPALVASLTTADFNGDGNADLAVTSYNSDVLTEVRVTVLLGSGDGAFTQSSFVSRGYGDRTSIASGDFNKDTKIDLATSGCVHLGNGDGTFGPCIALQTGNPGTYFGQIFAVGDFNRDRGADLAMLEYYYRCHCAYSFADVLLGNADGTFGHVAGYQGLGFNMQSGAAGDFNLDGVPDLAMSSRFCDAGEICDSGIRVFFGNGDGSLGPPSDFGLGYLPTSVVTADFDGDGRPDVAVTGNNIVSILLTRPR